MKQVKLGDDEQSHRALELLGEMPHVSTAPAHQIGDIDLMLVSEIEGTDVASINLSDAEFGRLVHSAAAQKLSMQQLLTLGFEQMANPLSTPQQRMDFRTLESSIDAAASLLVTLAQNADRGLKTVTDIVISKLNDDFATASAAFKMPLAESFIASGGAR
jgi:hypothetical protein